MSDDIKRIYRGQIRKETILIKRDSLISFVHSNCPVFNWIIDNYRWVVNV